MNSDYDKILEAEVHRELNALPELSAPRTLTARVMAGIAKQSALPWYRRAWVTWPKPARVCSFAAMAVFFCALSFVIWRLGQPAVSGSFLHTTEPFVSLAGIWSALTAVVNAVALTFSKLGSGFLIASVTIAILNYLACIGLGTAVVRFAAARLRRNEL